MKHTKPFGKGSLILISFKPYKDAKRTKNSLGVVVGNTKDVWGNVLQYHVIEFNFKGLNLLKYPKSFFKYGFAEPYDNSRLSFEEGTTYRGMFFPLAEWCTIIERGNTIL